MLHGSKGDAHGGIVAHHLNVASGQAYVLAGLRRASSGRAIDSPGLRNSTVEQRAYHSGLGEDFEFAALHLLTQQATHAQGGVDLDLAVVDGLREVGLHHRAAGAGAYKGGGGGDDVGAGHSIGFHGLGIVQDGVDVIGVLIQTLCHFVGYLAQSQGLGHGLGAEVVVIRGLGQRGVVGHQADEFLECCCHNNND